MPAMAYNITHVISSMFVITLNMLNSSLLDPNFQNSWAVEVSKVDAKIIPIAHNFVGIFIGIIALIFYFILCSQLFALVFFLTHLLSFLR